MSKKMLAGCMLMTCAMAFPVSALAQSTLTVETTTATQTWTINANSQQELVRSINAGSPLPADYGFELGMVPQYARSASGECRLAGGTLSVHTIVTEPDWTNRNGASRGLRQEWDRYLERVRLHAQGHLDISGRGAAIVAQRLEAIPAQPGCDALEALIVTSLSELQGAMDASHRDYDSQSGGLPRVATPAPSRR